LRARASNARGITSSAGRFVFEQAVYISSQRLSKSRCVIGSRDASAGAASWQFSKMRPVR
jgi:hypothetical protein